MIDLEELKRLAMNATSGKWEWWTSNSEKRITSTELCGNSVDGNVLHAYYRNAHADVACSQNDMDYIEAAQPQTVLSLIQTIERQREEITELSKNLTSMKYELNRLKYVNPDGSIPGSGPLKIDGVFFG